MKAERSTVPTACETLLDGWGERRNVLDTFSMKPGDDHVDVRFG